MTPGVGLFGGVEGQLGGSDITTYEAYEGNATTTFYGRYLLRQAAKHMAASVKNEEKPLRIIAHVLAKG